MRRVALLGLLLGLACGDTLPEHAPLAIDRGYVRVPLASVADGNVHFYSVESGGKRINILVRPDAKGTLHAHLDACYACYHYRRGFVVEGGTIVCRACRYSYDLGKAEWDYIGACAPIPLATSIEDGDLRIRVRTIRRAERYF